MSSFGIHQIGIVRIDKEACYIELSQLYTTGLRHIDKFSHIFVLWWISMRDNPQDRSQMLATPPKLETSRRENACFNRSF